jgi:hypothetical protein
MRRTRRGKERDTRKWIKYNKRQLYTEQYSLITSIFRTGARIRQERSEQGEFAYDILNSENGSGILFEKRQTFTRLLRRLRYNRERNVLQAKDYGLYSRG